MTAESVTGARPAPSIKVAPRIATGRVCAPAGEHKLISASTVTTRTTDRRIFIAPPYPTKTPLRPRPLREDGGEGVTSDMHRLRLRGGTVQDETVVNFL